MSINNLNNVHLTDQQVNAVNKAIADLETALRVLTISLTPEERSKYGRVNEQNKLLVNKIYDFAQHQSALRSPDVDWAEFFKDYKSRGLYENWINRLDNLQIKMKNAKILHDYDNHQDALADYAYTSYKAGMRSADFEDKHKECKQFFARSKKAKPSEKDANPTEE